MRTPAGEIMMRLVMAGIPVHRINCPGMPQLVGWVPARLFDPAVSGTSELYPVPLFICLERPGGRRKSAQDLFIGRAKKDCAIAFYAGSWSEVRSNLAQHGLKLSK